MPPAELIAHEKFSSASLKKRIWAKNLLSFLALQIRED